MAQSGSNRSRNWTTVAVRPETLRRLKGNLRGGESMDKLLRKMEAQYEPDRGN